METTGIKLFGKKIMCYNSPKNTNLRILTGEEFSDCSNDEVAGFDKMEHSDEDQVRERKQEDGNTRKTETEGDTTNSQLKKPDTILPCPRCKSMDTKFCYYNNYNVKQPRHFCKSCQRYWTAGGTMRTMPVGAGRRRNKNPPSHDQAFLDSQINVPNGVPRVHPKFLSFGLDLAHFDKENLDELSSSGSGSTVTTSNSESEKIQDRNRFNSHESSIPSGVSWIYNPWNSAVPIPSFYPAGFSPMPMPIYPSPYWNYIPSWLQNDTNSSILGKHSRERELVKSNGSEEPKKQKSSVLFPKARRFDDPDESAKSSIWLTLGIKNDDISTRGVFKALPTRGEENNKHTVSTSTTPVLQANPAALSRSFCFQETA